MTSMALALLNQLQSLEIKETERWRDPVIVGETRFSGAWDVFSYVPKVKNPCILILFITNFSVTFKTIYSMNTEKMYQTKFHHYFRKYFLRKLFVSQQNSTIITFLLRGCTTRPGRHGWCAKKSCTPLDDVCDNDKNIAFYLLTMTNIFKCVLRSYFGRHCTYYEFQWHGLDKKI